MVLYCFKCSDFYVIDDIRMLSLQKFGFSMVFLDVFSWWFCIPYGPQCLVGEFGLHRLVFVDPLTPEVFL